VFSNYALKGLDSKVSPEMRSTGEGISLAMTYEEAMKKSFHTLLKDRPTGRVAVKPSYILDVKKAGVKEEAVIEASELTASLVKEEAIIAYYNPDQGLEDKKVRETATKNRVLTFTEEETLLAFLAGQAAKEFSVHSLNEWLSKKREVKLT
jgi:carbamoyl-phosphate synthase large subunit